MVIGILGILKAGAAYVPIDPDYPAHRIKFMLQDSQAKYVLTQKKLITSLQPLLSLRYIILDQDSPIMHTAAKDNPAVLNQPDSLAYIIYTSGSTGEPKGVEATHLGITRLVKNTNYIEIKTTDRIAQAGNVAFDAATFEIWGALLNGATSVILPREVVLDSHAFTQAIQQGQVNVLWLTAGLFNKLIDLCPLAFRKLDYLIVGGESLSVLHVNQLMQQTQVPKYVINGYGPTENTTFTTYYLIKSVVKENSIPIGKPICNTQVYILSPHLSPCPIGVLGELYIGGDGLARGYLNRPDFTEERFIHNPFSNDPNSHLYKTGDLVRWLSDGNIEYIGRNDDQVKIRGFRIELGEIEAQLLIHPQVRQCVVLAKARAEDKCLMAYLVPKEKDSLEVQMLRDFLKHNLPDYMIPSAFVVLNALPLTPNGKVDKKALAQQEVNYLTALAHYVAARSPEEQALIAIWAEVLKQNPESIGVHDNFFTLGGHSLLAISVISRIRILFQVKLPLANLFDHPTVSSLMEHIHQLRNAENQPAISRPRLTRRSE